MTPEGLTKRALAKMCTRHGAILHTNVQGRGAIKGFPDVTIIKQGGEVAFVELKRAGATQKALAPPQVGWRDKLLQQNANWFFYNLDEELTNQIEKWLSK